MTGSSRLKRFLNAHFPEMDPHERIEVGFNKKHTGAGDAD